MFSAKSSLETEHQAESCELDPRTEGGSSSSPISNILDMPDGMLREIISHLNARERLPLGHSCQKFNRLVFRDAQCLSYLEFSIKAHLTSAKVISEYFANEDTCKHIKKLNLKNVQCLNPGRVLISFIGKATNLVDLNIQGIIFKDILELAYFLNPLIYLQRLSIDWPHMKQSHIPFSLQVLEHPFSRLVYLSVKMMLALLKVFIPSLRLCHELKELRMIVKDTYTFGTYNDIWDGETNKELRNLEIVEYCGPHVEKIKELFVTMFIKPEKWTDFQLNRVNNPKGFHIEKNVEVCEELLECRWMDRIPNSAWNSFNLGWALFPECFLKKVLITQQSIKEDLCFLSTFMDAKRCLLTIKDAKGLLKNPRYQISSLFINHEIDIRCDVHLLASVFPNLTELVLSAVTRNLDIPLTDANLQRRVKIQTKAAPEKPYKSLDLRTPFQLLTENTPHLQHLTLDGSAGHQNWDLDELHHISNWKNLQTLRLVAIPLEGGNFLIEIGKQCKNLQKLELIRLDVVNLPGSYSCYMDGLFQMLKHCENLKDFSIVANSISGFGMFTALQASSTQLRRVHVTNLLICNLSVLISLIKQLLCRCSILTTFKCHAHSTVQQEKLPDKSTIYSLKIGRDPDFEIEVFYRNKSNENPWETDTIKEDTPHNDPFFFFKSDTDAEKKFRSLANNGNFEIENKTILFKL